MVFLCVLMLCCDVICFCLGVLRHAGFAMLVVDDDVAAALLVIL